MVRRGTLREDSSEVVTHLLLRQWNPSIQAFKSIIRGVGRSCRMLLYAGRAECALLLWLS